MYTPKDFAYILNVVMWTQTCIASVFVGLRMYTRYYLIRNVGWDDLLMIANLATFLGFTVAISVGTAYGVGKQTSDILRLGLDNSKAIKWEAIGQAICIMGIAASKASVALFLLRIVRQTWHIALLWFCIISTTILSTITTVLLFVQCKPTAYLWDHTIVGGNCWLHDFVNVALTMGAWSASMDFILAILPWHVVISLNMKREEKITITVALSLGVIAGICSIIRTVKLKSLSSTDEYVYRTATMLLWSSSEICLTVICACTPVLRPLYMRVRYGSKYSGGGGQSGRSYPLENCSNIMKNNARDLIAPQQAGGKAYAGDSSAAMNTTVNTAARNSGEEAILREFHEQNGSPFDPSIAWSKEILITTTVESRGDNV